MEGIDKRSLLTIASEYAANAFWYSLPLSLQIEILLEGYKGNKDFEYTLEMLLGSDHIQSFLDDKREELSVRGV